MRDSSARKSMEESTFDLPKKHPIRIRTNGTDRRICFKFAQYCFLGLFLPLSLTSGHNWLKNQSSPMSMAQYRFQVPPKSNKGNCQKYNKDLFWGKFWPPVPLQVDWFAGKFRKYDIISHSCFSEKLIKYSPDFFPNKKKKKLISNFKKDPITITSVNALTKMNEQNTDIYITERLSRYWPAKIDTLNNKSFRPPSPKKINYQNIN